MAFAPRLIVALLAPLLAGCSEGDNDDGKLSNSASLDPSSSADDSAGSTAPTTAELPPGTTTGTTTTGDEPTSSSTAAEGTTTTVTTTGDDTSTGGTTGSICDPGQVGCICDDGLCADGYVCELDLCVPAPMVCPGDLEPGDDDEASAKNVGSITDDDGEQFTVSGVLSGAPDGDWYTYHGKDTFGYIVEPTLSLVEGDMRMCQFLVCDEGGAALTKVTCPANSKFAISPTLRPGCCASTSFTIKEFDCSGQDESATIWMRIDKPTVDECTNYEFKVSF